MVSDEKLDKAIRPPKLFPMKDKSNVLLLRKQTAESPLSASTWMMGSSVRKR